MENTENNNKKKAIVGLTIGIISLIILIGGAAYAYWTANTSINFNTATITYETGDEAIVILNGTSAELTLGTLTPDDMAKLNNNTAYYASATGKKTTITEEAVGVATPYYEGDINSYRCNFTLSFSHSGSADLIDRFLSETNGEPDYANRSAGQIFLTVNGIEYDINDGFPNTVSGVVFASQNHPGEIKVGFKFVNLSGVNQTYLANSNGIIEVDLANNGFSCEVIGNTEYAYWTWEDDDHNTSDTVQNKVRDYRDLPPYDFYVLSADAINIDGTYDSLQECQNDSDGNYVCSNSLYFFEVADSSVGTYSTESECLSATSDWTPFSDCVYDNEIGSWLAYDPSYGTYLTESDCLLNHSNDNFRDRCVQNSSKYVLYLAHKRSSKYDTLADCEDDLDDYSPGQHPMCAQATPRVFVREQRYPTNIVNSNNNKWNIYYPTNNIYQSLDECNANINSNQKCFPESNTYTVEAIVESFQGTNSTFDTESDCLDFLGTIGASQYGLMGNGITIFCGYKSDINKYVVYEYMSDLNEIGQGKESCETSLANMLSQNGNNSTVTANCVMVNTALETIDSSIGDFNSEDDCSTYINNNNVESANCKYNDVSNKYDLVMLLGVFPSNVCQGIVQNLPNGITGSCSTLYDINNIVPIPNNDFNNKDECLDQINDLPDNETLACYPKYEIGETVYNSNADFCGYINDNLVCFNPYSSSMDDYIDLMESYNLENYGYSDDDDYVWFDYGNSGVWTEFDIDYSTNERWYWVEDYTINVGCELSNNYIDCYDW